MRTSSSPRRASKSNYPGTIIITCCDIGFYDGINPPIFTGGTIALNWPLGVYDGSYGKFVVALAPSAPEISTWGMMLVDFGGLGCGAGQARCAIRAHRSPLGFYRWIGVKVKKRKKKKERKKEKKKEEKEKEGENKRG